MYSIKSIFEEFNEHLIKDEQPSKYFEKKLEEGVIFSMYPFTMLGELNKIEQNPQHHPEGNVWKHIMLVIDNAAKVKHKSMDEKSFMWAALLHDIGKSVTTKIRNGRITAYDHDKLGKNMTIDFLKELTADTDFIDKTSILVRWHMQILYVVKQMSIAEIEKMISEVSIKEIALLSSCDRLGRGGLTREKYDQELKYNDLFVEKCYKYI